MELEKKFVGPRGVVAVVVDEMKTFSGADVVNVHYEGGYIELMSKKTYELISSNEPSDYTAIRNKKFEAMYNELYPIIATYLIAMVAGPEEKKQARIKILQDAIAMISEYDIKVSEIESFMNPILGEMNGLANAIGFEIDNTFNRATNFLWTKNDAGFIPGTNMMMERTILEAKKVNSTIPTPVVIEEKEPETIDDVVLNAEEIINDESTTTPTE